MIKAHLKQIGGRCIASNMATEFCRQLIGPHDHGQGIPTHDACDALFDLQRSGATGVWRLLIGGNGVDVRRIARPLPIHTQGLRGFIDLAD